MQINVHNFTLTAPGKATITVQSDSTTIHDLPIDLIKTLGTTEALDLTGFDWEVKSYNTTDDAEATRYTYNLKLNII